MIIQKKKKNKIKNKYISIKFSWSELELKFDEPVGHKIASF